MGTANVVGQRIVGVGSPIAVDGWGDGQEEAKDMFPISDWRGYISVVLYFLSINQYSRNSAINVMSDIMESQCLFHQTISSECLAHCISP